MPQSLQDVWILPQYFLQYKLAASSWGMCSICCRTSGCLPGALSSPISSQSRTLETSLRRSPSVSTGRLGSGAQHLMRLPTPQMLKTITEPVCFLWQAASARDPGLKVEMERSQLGRQGTACALLCPWGIPQENSPSSKWFRLSQSRWLIARRPECFSLT